jgi:hypothetical protein
MAETVGDPMMSRPRVFFVIFVTFSAIAGMLYWWNGDWWAYRLDIWGRWQPKFKIPAWWQVVQSTLVGVLAGGAATLAMLAVDRLVHWWRGS